MKKLIMTISLLVIFVSLVGLAQAGPKDIERGNFPDILIEEDIVDFQYNYSSLTYYSNDEIYDVPTYSAFYQDPLYEETYFNIINVKQLSNLCIANNYLGEGLWPQTGYTSENITSYTNNLDNQSYFLFEDTYKYSWVTGDSKVILVQMNFRDKSLLNNYLKKYPSILEEEYKLKDCPPEETEPPKEEPEEKEDEEEKIEISSDYLILGDLGEWSHVPLPYSWLGLEENYCKSEEGFGYCITYYNTVGGSQTRVEVVIFDNEEGVSQYLDEIDEIREDMQFADIIRDYKDSKVYEEPIGYSWISGNLFIRNIQPSAIPVLDAYLTKHPSDIKIQAEAETECSGCLYDSDCLPFGNRVKIDSLPSYCEIDKTLKVQKETGEECQNNYECQSNVCVSSKCISPSLIEKIIEWFKKLFS